jgi:hypothetical protein
MTRKQFYPGHSPTIRSHQVAEFVRIRGGHPNSDEFGYDGLRLNG